LGRDTQSQGDALGCCKAPRQRLTSEQRRSPPAVDRLRQNVGCHACARASMLTRCEHGTHNSRPGRAWHWCV